MIVNFREINFDQYGNIEPPDLTLKYLNGNIESSIGLFYDFHSTFRYNDVSEISFKVPAYHDGIEVPYYNQLTGFKIIEFKPFGDFIIVSPQSQNDGIKEYKEVKAYSLEYVLNYKQLTLPKGTYNFYNPIKGQESIINFILELIPDWQIGSVDKKLWGKWRTFDNVNEKLYPFIMNDVQKVYNCLFLFDTNNKTISAISADAQPDNSPIYMSFDNLIENIQVEELSEEVTTVLSGYGSKDMSIASVNPNGTDKIYNLDWLIATGNMSEKLANRWNEYQTCLNYYQKVFADLNTLYSEKLLTQQLANANLMIAKSEMDAAEAALIAAKADSTLSDWQTVVNRYSEALDTAKAKYESENIKIQECEKDVLTLKSQINEILSYCKLSNFFSNEKEGPDQLSELEELSMYFKEDSLVESSFVVPEFNSTVNSSEQSTITNESNAVLTIDEATQEFDNEGEFTSKDIFYTDDLGEYVPINEDGGLNIVPPGDIDLDLKIDKDIANTVTDKLNKDIKRGAYKLRGGKLTYEYTSSKIVNGKIELHPSSIEGDLFNASLIYNKVNLRKLEHNEDINSLPDIEKQGYFIFSALLKNAIYKEYDKYGAILKNTQFPSANISLQGMMRPIANLPNADRKPNINSKSIGFKIERGTFYNTASVTYFQRQSVYQELYDYVKDALKKVSEPSYQFDVDSANYIFDEDFISFTKHTALGNTINLDIDDNENSSIIKPILIELSLNYDDPTDFKITFSNKYKASNPEFLLADIIGESVRSTKSFELNKSSYSSYVDSGADKALDETLNNEYDIARHAIINSENQGIEWNSKGLFLRKKEDEGYYSPEQIAMINNMIAFTDDSWNSVELAIGKFRDKNAGDVWGIAAPNIKGTLFAGENLIIENTVFGEDGVNIKKEFKVDKTGAWLKNSALYFGTDEGNSGKMLLDPRYGFAAGNKDLYSETDGINTIPSFIDEKGKLIFENIVIDNKTTVRVPKNTSLYFDSNSGKAYFKGDIYAENGYFAGTIDASNIIAGSLKVDGKDIIPGTIDANDKLTGNINPNQMSQNVIDAINKYIQDMISQGKDPNQIGNQVIGNLSANQITSGNIDAERISANVIDAINGSFGKINADKLNVDVAKAGNVLVINDNAKIMINPDYGIVAGNKDLFDVDEDGNIINTTFIQNGNLAFEKDAEGNPIGSAPLNTSFFFDIKTGKAYFSGSLSASDITVGKLNPDRIDASQAFIDDAWIKNLSAEKITAGSIGTDILTANVVKAIMASTELIHGEKIMFDQGYIKDAWIGDLSADKITSGSLDTNKVAVRSEDGSFLIQGNLTQWTDNTGTVRLQAGQDNSGDFNFAIFGKDGKTAYFDQDGIHADGIRDNILVDSMFKPIGGGYPGISGDKLNINSVIKRYNEDGTTTINSGKIQFNQDYQPIYKTILDENGYPVQVPVIETYYTYVLDSEGKIQYDASGQPLLTKHERQKVNEFGQPITEDKRIQKVDEKGNPIFEMKKDVNGDPIYAPKLDEFGEPISSSTGNTIYEENPIMEPVYEVELDENGDPLFEDKGLTLDMYIAKLESDLQANITDIQVSNNKIETSVSQIKGNITSTNNNLDKINGDLNELKSYTESKLLQTSKYIEALFTQIQNTDDNVSRYIRLEEQGIEFGEKEKIDLHQMPKIQLGTYPLEGEPTDEGKLIFYNTNGVPVAWLTEDTLKVTNARINTRLFLGNFAFIPRGNTSDRRGNLSFVKNA